MKGKTRDEMVADIQKTLSDMSDKGKSCPIDFGREHYVRELRLTVSELLSGKLMTHAQLRLIGNLMYLSFAVGVFDRPPERVLEPDESGHFSYVDCEL